MYEELVGELHLVASGVQSKRRRELLEQAADAIEELSRAQEYWIEQERSVLLKSIPRWIPVTERLPEPFTRALCYMAWKAITVVEWQNNNWYSIDHLEPLPREAVSHWQPLPEPPEEGIT